MCKCFACICVPWMGHPRGGQKRVLDPPSSFCYILINWLLSCVREQMPQCTCRDWRTIFRGLDFPCLCGWGTECRIFVLAALSHLPETQRVILKAKHFRDWRDGAVVSRTGCSSRGPKFHSPHPHGGSQTLCNSRSRGSMASEGNHTHVHRHTCR